MLAAPLAVVAAGAPGVLLLARRSLSTDEAVAVEQARLPLRELVEHAIEHDPGSLGFLALLHPVVAWSDAEWAVRLPAVGTAMLAALLAYALGRTLFGPVAGAVAGLGLALNGGVLAAAQQVRPYTLAIAAVLLATLVFALALRGSPAWWLAYVPACALLALAHPIAVTVLPAHAAAAALALRGRRPALVRAAVAIALGAAAAAPLALAAVADRADAADGAGGLRAEDVAVGLLRAGGWNAALIALAALGLAALLAGRATQPAWRAALVAGLVAAPVLAVLATAVFLPVYPERALVVCAPGVALAAGAAVVWLPDGVAARVAAAAVAVLAVPALVLWYVRPASEDWRSALAALEARRQPGETVLVVPARAEAAASYYAPSIRVVRRARGDGAWVLVRSGSDRLAIRAARRRVRTPAYALLAQERHGDRLVLQHWVRP